MFFIWWTRTDKTALNLNLSQIRRWVSVPQPLPCSSRCYSSCPDPKLSSLWCGVDLDTSFTWYSAFSVLMSMTASCSSVCVRGRVEVWSSCSHTSFGVETEQTGSTVRLLTSNSRERLEPRLQKIKKDEESSVKMASQVCSSSSGTVDEWMDLDELHRSIEHKAYQPPRLVTKM